MSQILSSYNMGCVFLPLDLLPQKRRLPANPMQALLHLFILSSLAAISWSCFVCRNPLTSLAPDAPVPTARHQQLLLPASSKLWGSGHRLDIILPCPSHYPVSTAGDVMRTPPSIWYTRICTAMIEKEDTDLWQPFWRT